MENESKCPVAHGSESQHNQGARSNNQWWPDNLNIDILHQHDTKSNPMNGFDSVSYTHLTLPTKRIV